MREQHIAWIAIIAVAVISYLIGSVNFSIMLSKKLTGKDIRESGSGNAGATNMLRTHGKKMAIATLILDVLKGVLAIVISWIIGGITIGLFNKLFDMWDLWNYAVGDIFAAIPYIAAVCVVLGHNFPLYFGFKGGKGVATSLGVVMMLDWKIGLIIAVIAIAVMAITRYVSLGSIIGGALYIVINLAIFITQHVRGSVVNITSMVCVVILGGLLIARHHANIGRLLNGTENKLSFSKKEN